MSRYVPIITFTHYTCATRYFVTNVIMFQHVDVVSKRNLHTYTYRYRLILKKKIAYTCNKVLHVAITKLNVRIWRY